MTPADIAAALLRTTLATTVAALAAWALLAWLRVDSPRIHRTAWLLVIAQGWLFFPLTIEIETASPSAAKRAAGLVPAGIHEAEPVPVENEAQWGRGPFATSDSSLAETPPSQKVPDPFSLVIASWLLGAIALAILAIYRYWQVLRTLPLGSPPDAPEWQAEWRSALAAAKLRRRQTADLRITASLGPLLHWAPWAYLVLVPRTLWITLASPERQAVLRHELAHLRRYDLWKSLAIRVLALPQWFNPLAWLAIRRFDEAAEWACDDAAAATDAGRLTFANSLLQSAEYAIAPYPASAPAARGVLTRRIHRLVSPRFKEESKMKLLVPPLLLLLLAMCQTIHIERVVAAETPPQPSRSDEWSLVEQFNVPLGERLKHAEQRHRKLLLLAEEQRQLDFDRLTKEFEDFARKDYVIEPPDILLIESDKLVPKAPHRIETFDKLQIRAGVASHKPRIDDSYNVDSDGEVNLGAPYGRVNIVGRTIEEAEGVLREQLSGTIASVDASVTLLAASRASVVAGQHLVAIDGRVNLEYYGSVYVSGMTLKEAQAAIERKLAEQFDDPKVLVDVLAYNSKVAYLILQGDQNGDHVTRVPLKYPYTLTMNVGALLKEATYPNPIDFAAAKISVARPAPSNAGAELRLSVKWDADRGAPTATTNYPLLPGDRIFIATSEERDPRRVRPVPTLDPPPSPVTPPTPVDESNLQRPSAVEINLTVIEDSADALAEFRSGAPGMIMADAKTFQAALRTFEKNGLVRLSSQRLQCKFGESMPTSVVAPIPNPLQRKSFRTADSTELFVKPLGDDLFFVKIEFKQKVDGNEVRESINLGMRSGETNVLECTGIAVDESQPKTKTYLAVTAAPPTAVQGNAAYRLQPHDTLKLRVTRPSRPAHTLTWGDFEGEFTVNQDGEVKLGRATGGGAVSVAGMTANEARDAIEQHLRKESAGCELQLALSTLAAEKYVIAIQRADGTELAVGALPPDFIFKSDFLEWPLFRSFIAELTPISEVKLERADRHGKTESIKLTTIWDAIQAPQMPACDCPVRPGDRLVVTVADDWQPRIFPSWLEPRDVQRRRGQTLFRIGEGWSQVGGVKFDHPDVQRPAVPFQR